MTSLSKQYGDWFVTDGVTVGPGSDGVAYNWSYEPPPVPSPASGPSPAGAYFAQGSDSAPETQTDVVPASAPLSSATAVGAVAGTPHADVFPLDIATVNAAVAPVPQPAQITGYSALQGDVIDFSAILHGSYAPLTPDTAQLH